MLLCNPFGEEAARAHRVYRVLGMQLARAGFAALRFDYAGTGDSHGDGADATVDEWIGDVEQAADQLRGASGASRIAVIGLRFGATLAVLASARDALRPRHLLLWDPVVDGAAYLRELAGQHRTYMRDELGAKWIERARPGDAAPTEVIGTPIGAALAAEVAAIDLGAVSPGAEHLTVISTRNTPELERLRPRTPAATRWLELSGGAAWNSDAALNSMTVPMEIVQALVARLEETSP